MTASAALRPTGKPTTLAALLPGAPEVTVSGVSLSSRSVRPGDLYLALPGTTTHGANFAAAAVAAGAVAVLTDAAGAALARVDVPVVVVTDPRAEMAGIAATVYGHPADRLALYGVTGTAGKTSTTFLLAAGLAASGRRVGTIGTIGFSLDGQPLAGDRTTITTPEAPDLQALLGYLVEHGAEAVAMEVSSHALAQGRVAGLVFDVAAFTNLGRDHLDFHRDQEDYFQAKAALFRDGRARTAVINIDDDYGRRLAAEVRASGVPLVTTGAGTDADYHPVTHEVGPDGRRRVRLATPGGEREFSLSLLGEFNVRNAVTAAAMLDLAGVDLGTALTGFETAYIPGRMQRVELGPGAPGVVVDFAHTPEAVAAALAALPPGGRRIAVLGCGGDRDQAKRGPMGAAAATGADIVVVTDDNPRSEEPQAIRAAVLAGARQAAAASGAQVHDGGGRADAIRLALGFARPGDWVALLGKGHETGQELGGRILDFDDRLVAAVQWAALKGKTNA